MLINIAIVLVIACAGLLLGALVIAILRSDPIELLITVGKVAGWVVFFTVLAGIMCALAGFIGLLLWFTTPVIALLTVTRYRDAERRSLIWALGMAAEKGISLSSAARSFAEERRGQVGRKASELADALDRGLPLDAALATAKLWLPTDALVAVRTGTLTGTLGPSLQSAASTSGPLNAAANRLGAQFVYLALYTTLAVVVIFFATYKLVPEMISIFESFGLRFPPWTILAINVEYLLYRNPFLLLLLIGAIVVPTCFAFARFVGLTRWDPPVLRRLWSRLDEAIILRTIGHGVEREKSFSSILDILARAFPKAHVRTRLQRAQHLVDQGASWSESLVTCGLLQRADANVLAAAERVGNLRWALAEVADSQVRRFAARATTAQSLAFPVVVVIASTAVFFLVATLFLPLVDLILTLA